MNLPVFSLEEQMNGFGKQEIVIILRSIMINNYFNMNQFNLSGESIFILHLLS